MIFSVFRYDNRQELLIPALSFYSGIRSSSEPLLVDFIVFSVLFKRCQGFIYLFYKRFVSFFGSDAVVLGFHDVTDHLAFAAVHEVVSDDRLVIDDGVNALVVEFDERFVGVVVLFDVSAFNRAGLCSACCADLCTDSFAD